MLARLAVGVFPAFLLYSNLLLIAIRIRIGRKSVRIKGAKANKCPTDAKRS